ncbi:MAG: transporter substrate-binding domain-containing protein [Pseudomonadota bacterium]
MPCWPSEPLSACALLCAALLPHAAGAACSRPVQVAVAALGATVTVNGEQVGGIVPDMLRKVGGAKGCEFKFVAVPRARAEAMFEAGQSDMLLTATHSELRDRLGYFTPMTQARPMLISIASNRPALHSIRELLGSKHLRVALVRGFDYGAPYQAMIAQLTAEGRLILEANPLNIARLLHTGVADATIMLPLIMAGAIDDEARVAGMGERLRIEALEELSWIDAGSYISRTAVSAHDREQLNQILGEIAHSKLTWDAYTAHYAEKFLSGSFRLR